MSNDPDLIEQPCPDCGGSGVKVVDNPDGEPYGVPCDDCYGEGVR